MRLATESSSGHHMHAKRLLTGADDLRLRLSVELRARREVGILRPPLALQLGWISGGLVPPTACDERRRIRLQCEWWQCANQRRRGPASSPAARRIRPVAQW